MSERERECVCVVVVVCMCKTTPYRKQSASVHGIGEEDVVPQICKAGGDLVGVERLDVSRDNALDTACGCSNKFAIELREEKDVS